MDIRRNNHMTIESQINTNTPYTLTVLTSGEINPHQSTQHTGIVRIHGDTEIGALICAILTHSYKSERILENEYSSYGSSIAEFLWECCMILVLNHMHDFVKAIDSPSNKTSSKSIEQYFTIPHMLFYVPTAAKFIELKVINISNSIPILDSLVIS
jgi:hypothetical protein